MRKNKVLIVDDDKEFLEELREMLTSRGYDTEAFSDGASALRMIDNIKPDIMLLDLKMGGKSGFQIAHELKRLPAARIPIIAVTGFYNEKQHNMLMNVCGIQTCLVKPLNPADVISKIEELLKERKRGR